ncbi:Chitin-binding type-2 domain-containing protein [Caenorhabditis elegans]|uniref:Chitin-binding type-2 domain-containing protein n=1 Tax=Caenorhabditis elegans TaxID=6239 RepID=U4PQR6_CAEEL|nr:Chitin-binding type-2 domain-containing protein [Caenorhabditis elegans]CDH92936.1 Chitin-binding type-2 domain-containing protein [Caenorhabditis elegans]|eukprot:NP_001294250.1 Uncharacterized protein CELE_T11F8.12 [Caenorhabditis elegans]
MKLNFRTFLLFFTVFLKCSLTQLVSQQEVLGVQGQGRFPYICGSDPFRFYSEFPCNMYPVCINGGFKINVGCNSDYQCTPYSASAVCVNNCCCTVPRIVGPDITTTRRFFDNSMNYVLNPFYFVTVFIFFLLF